MPRKWNRWVGDTAVLPVTPSERRAAHQARKVHLANRRREKLAKKKGKAPAKKAGKACGSHYWTGPLTAEGYPPGFNYPFKQTIRARQGWRCAWCGTHKGDTPEQLHVHHKDKDKRNSAYSNLIGLCCDCHTLIAHGGYYSDLRGRELREAIALQKAKIVAWEAGAKERRELDQELDDEREQEAMRRAIIGRLTGEYPL
jgi:5-methylcytosine-specific restriction endonuclease McrA